MSDSSNASFAQFVPGFDFLQNLTKNTSQAIPQMPNMANWIAPTLSVEELEKRIAELKAVHFWLDQNSKALGATVQALEVQKMTLVTLKSMNFNMAEVANAFTIKPAESVASGQPKTAAAAATTVQPVSDMAGKTEEMAKKVGEATQPAAAALVDPMQLWTSLTQQFQTIAASAMAEAGKVTALDLGKNLVNGAAKGVVKQAANVAAKKAPVKRAAAKAAAKKTAISAVPKAAGLRRR
ncbi:MAG TPA: PhaM family polyhydroxyalkanoate granule multifunctional regulatory protein [Rhodoferax sp.]